MNAKSIEREPIGNLTLPIVSWNSESLSNGDEAEYIDIASIDRDSKTITRTTRITRATAPSRARQIVRAGDILVSTVRPNLNAVAVIPQHLDGAIASTGFCVLRCKPAVKDERYLFHWLRTSQFISAMERLATGASYPAVSDRIIKESLYPAPSYIEQRRIAGILDNADAIRRKRREAAQVMAEYPHALFLDMFGHPDRNPKRWEVLPFSEVCASRLGKMLDAKQQTGNHNRPYMRNLNVQWGRLDLSEVFEMDFDESHREECRLRYGDVLICEGGAGVGQTAIWRDELPECYFQKSLHRVRPFPHKAIPEYIAFLMWTMMKGSSLLRSISSATIPHLTGEKLKQVRIPVPPIDLQLTFQKQVLKYEAATENATRATKESHDLFNSLVQRCFGGEA